MRFQGLVYRAHNPSWSFDPLSGEGAKRFGGRFNPVGVEALYTAISETVALAEYNQGFPHRPQPKTLCAYEVDCDDLIDLTDSNQCDSLFIREDELAAPWEFISNKESSIILSAKTKNTGIPPTWMIANQLRNTGAAGVIVPSFANNAPTGGKNIVFWRWGADKPYQVLLIDDDGRLPKDRSSWE
ncbi:MAG: RES domain-containing protein [Gammaproteobacteria bacterium]|nr:RES domain-containing protein [Gammaproteobacteria bacterium]